MNTAGRRFSAAEQVSNRNSVSLAGRRQAFRGGLGVDLPIIGFPLASSASTSSAARWTSSGTSDNSSGNTKAGSLAAGSWAQASPDSRRPAIADTGVIKDTGKFVMSRTEPPQCGKVKAATVA